MGTLSALLPWILLGYFVDRRTPSSGMLTQLQGLFGPKPRTHP